MPPELTVYHWIVLPEEVALILELLPLQINEGEAVTDVGAAGTGFTVTVTCFVVIGSPSPARYKVQEIVYVLVKEEESGVIVAVCGVLKFDAAAGDIEPLSTDHLQS